MSEQNPDFDSWHLDRKVPVAIILVIASQFVGGLWVLAEMRKDIEVLKMQMSEQRVRDDRQDKTGADAMSLVRAQLDRIEGNQYRMAEQGTSTRLNK